MGILQQWTSRVKIVVSFPRPRDVHVAEKEFLALRKIDVQCVRQTTDAQRRCAQEMKEFARQIRKEAVRMRVESELGRKISSTMIQRT